MKRILVTGAFGQIGTELVPALQNKTGVEKVIAMDHSNIPTGFSGIVETATVTDKAKLEEIIKKHGIDTVFHMASLLSVNGEKDPQRAWDVNINGLKNILDLAAQHKLRVFWPSSIAAFGPTTPRDNTPQKTVLEPTTMYGVTKVSGELLCQYYHLKYGVDVRSVRYPGIISWKAEPGGGTSDWAVAMFYDALKDGKYTCFVREDTVLPMMYMNDAIRATLMLMDAEIKELSIHTSYNLAAVSFSAGELAKEIRKHLPLEVLYVPDERQKIADSWPKKIDDSQARRDWGWKHEFDLPKITEAMIENLKAKLSL
ncbi:MAG: NAD-dependent epimerase/dehydratase family protein [bacterium]|nr:NAD-dependent epimerase/dehydratase family protein [bacterium]